MLDEAGFKDAKIIASNDLDEQTIMSLKSQGAKVDSWGVGTKLITGYDQPALGAVYKLVAVVDDNGRYVDRIKLSNNAEKVTTPGKKKVYRIINTKTGKAEGDYITLEHENPNNEKPLKMFHPVHTYKMKHIKHFEAIDLHHSIFENGKLVYQLPSEKEAQEYSKKALSKLWDENKRYLNPQEYPVDLSTACWDNKHKRIFEVAEHVKRWRKTMTNLQDIVVNEMKVKKHIDSEQESREIIQFIKSYVQSHSFIKSLVLGISGGQDSTLTGKLAQLAVEELRNEGRDCQFIAVKLPYGVQKDAEEVEDALNFIHPDEIITVNIKPAVDQSVKSLNEAGIELTDFQRGNEKHVNV